jgi:hypothetical protein
VGGRPRSEPGDRGEFFGAQQMGAGTIVYFDAAAGIWVNVTGISVPTVSARLSSATALANGVEWGLTLVQTKRLFESAIGTGVPGSGSGGAGGHDHELEVPPGF